MTLLVAGLPTASSAASPQTAQDEKNAKWENFHYPKINFADQAPGTDGSEIYRSMVAEPEQFIRRHILAVVQTLYWSAQDAMPEVKTINYTLKNIDGISAKGGSPPVIDIFYSTRWIEKKRNEKDGLLYETRGVLFHELTHGYQLEPKGIGGYRPGTEFWAFIEGMADAVRIHNGFHPLSNRKPGGNWMDGYQTTGFFLDWLTGKDPDFLRKFNRSTQEVMPWSFDQAMKHVLGEEHGIDGLWNEYQEFLRSQ